MALYFYYFRSVLIFSTLTIFFNPLFAQQKLSLNELLKTVNPDHPRIIYSFNVQERIESLQSNDLFLAQKIKLVIREAEDLLSSPTIEYQKDEQNTLGKSAEDAIKRVSTFVIAFRHTGRKEFFDRSIAEMDKIALLPSWNPEHFTDVAELTTALALGYDWLYTSLENETVKKYADALFTKGIKPGLMIYQSLQGQKAATTNWTNHQGTWNLVCNSGMLIGAIALARDYPGASAQIITYAVNSLSKTLSITSPSSTRDNGISWELASNHTVIAVSALKSSFGKDFGLSSYEGYENIYKSSTKFYDSQDVSPSIVLISKWFVNSTY